MPLNKRKLRTVLSVLEPSIKGELKSDQLKEDLSENLTQLVKSFSLRIQSLKNDLLNEFEDKISKLPDPSGELRNLKTEFESKIKELEKEDIVQAEISDTKTDDSLREELEEKIKRLRTEFFVRLNNLGGGQANREIRVSSSVASTRYTDINLIPGSVMSIAKADDDINKRVNLTISGIPSSIASAVVAGNNTEIQYNDAGTFGASSTLTWNKNSSVLSASNVNIPGFTQGSVPFQLSSSVLAQNNANLFWDNTNNRLGIGTAVPGDTLHVAGDIQFTNTRTRTMTRTIPTVVGDEVDIGAFTLTEGSGNFELWITVPSSGYSQNKRYFLPVQWNGTANLWQTVIPISSTGPYSGQDTDLEINVNNGVASFRLRRVAGTVAGTAYITILQQGVDTDAFVASTATSSVAAPLTTYTPTLINQTAGNVGIGTTSPQDILEVRKDTSGGLGGRILVSNLAAVAANNEANLGFKINSNFSATYYSARIANITTAANNNSDLAFYLYDGGAAGGTEKLRILNNGNVGIGTSSPSTTLHVAGTGRFSSGLTLDNGLTLTTGALNLTSTSGAVNLTLSSSTSAFNVNNFFNVDTTNNRVGLGTITPTSILHLASDAGTAASGISFGSAGDTNLYRSAANTLKTDDNFLIQTATNSTTAFQIQNATGTSNLFVADTTNSRIGIGTATPGILLGGANYPGAGTVLHIAPTPANDSASLIVSGSGINRASIVWEGGSGVTAGSRVMEAVYGGAGGNDLRFNVVNESTGAITRSSVLAIGNNGNVGIGIRAIDATANLHVAGTTLFKNTSDTTTAFQIQNATGTSILTVDTSARTVNFPTATSTATALVIGGDTNLYRSAADVLATDDSLQVGVFSTANSERLCWDAAGASLITDCTGTPGDYAEEYGTTDSSIGAGELVSIDPTKPAEEIEKDGEKGSRAWVLKSSKPYEGLLLGVVSTDPNEVIGKNFSPEENPRPIALVGRVPVKVSTENGPIVVGDPITSSLIPGIGMKATRAGRIVGIALNSYEGQGIGKIMVAINPTWYMSPALILTFDSGAYTGAGIEPVIGSDLVINLNESGKLVIKSRDSSNASSTEAAISFGNAGNAFFADKIQAGSIESPTITDINEWLAKLASSTDEIRGQLASSTENISRLEIDLGELKDKFTTLETNLAGVLEGNKGLQLDKLSLLGGALEINKMSDSQSELAFMSDTVFFGRPYFTTDTAGFAIIKQGQRSVDVTFEREYIEKPIVNSTITLDESSDPAIEEIILNGDIRYLVKRVSNKGFTILLDRPAPTDIQFSWTALAVKGAKTFTTIVPEVSPLVPPTTSSSSTEPTSSSSTEPAPAPDETSPTTTEALLPPTESPPPAESPPAESSSPLSEPTESPPPAESPPAESSPPLSEPTESPPPAEPAAESET